jgi:hypothetical protein
MEGMMTGRLAIRLLVVSVLATGYGAHLRAHDGHEHKVMGTVTMAAADRVMLTDTDQKRVTVQVTATTKVTRNGKPMKAEEVRAGTRIVVTALIEKDQTMTARLIEVGIAPPATK